MIEIITKQSFNLFHSINLFIKPSSSPSSSWFNLDPGNFSSNLLKKRFSPGKEEKSYSVFTSIGNSVTLLHLTLLYLTFLLWYNTFLTLLFITIISFIEQAFLTFSSIFFKGNSKKLKNMLKPNLLESKLLVHSIILAIKFSKIHWQSHYHLYWRWFIDIYIDSLHRCDHHLVISHE